MKKMLPTVVGFAAALILICVGVALNQQADVLAKAVKICLECVGIG